MSVRVSVNSDPQAEGYSYVNLVVVKTLGSETLRSPTTRGHTADQTQMFRLRGVGGRR
ncbi:hypothetical protein JCM18899A_12290 [Nocardioides sp. AN3]